MFAGMSSGLLKSYTTKLGSLLHCLSRSNKALFFLSWESYSELHNSLVAAWNGQALTGICASKVCCTPDTRSRSRSRFISEHIVESERATHSMENVEQRLQCTYALDHLGQ